MAMYNPPHPGEFITDIYLEPHGISGRELAAKLDVAASTLSRILKGTSRVTPEIYALNQYERALVDVMLKSKGHIKSRIW